MVNLTTPTEWTIAEYLIVGAILTLVMLVGGYVIGVAWQRWRDGRRKGA